MVRLLFFTIILCLSTTARSAIIASNYNYKFCNHHKFKFLLLNVYDAYLCVDDKKFLYPQQIFATNFSLIISYNMNFDKDKLSNSSIKEMQRYYNLDEFTQKKYYNSLISIFPNVTKGDIIEARYNKKSFIEFYYNGVYRGKIIGEDFSQKFLNIWLYKGNKYQEMTKDLFQ